MCDYDIRVPVLALEILGCNGISGLAFDNGTIKFSKIWMNECRASRPVELVVN